jgi:hypothetical protein
MIKDQVENIKRLNRAGIDEHTGIKTGGYFIKT